MNEPKVGKSRVVAAAPAQTTNRLIWISALMMGMALAVATVVPVKAPRAASVLRGSCRTGQPFGCEHHDKHGGGQPHGSTRYLA